MRTPTSWKMEYEPQKDTLELRIYSNVESDSWWKESETSAKYFSDKLKEYENAKEIKIYINSLGGSVLEGIAIYNQLKRHSAHKTVYIDGFACSIASVIAMAGDTVIMPKNTCMMIHNAWIVAMGSAKELRKAADDLDVINSAAIQAYLDRAGDKLTREKLTEMLDAETYLTAEQCIEYGFADKHSDDDAGDDSEPDGAAKNLAAETLTKQAAAEEMERRHAKCMAIINQFI